MAEQKHQPFEYDPEPAPGPVQMVITARGGYPHPNPPTDAIAENIRRHMAAHGCVGIEVEVRVEVKP